MMTVRAVPRMIVPLLVLFLVVMLSGSCPADTVEFEYVGSTIWSNAVDATVCDGRIYVVCPYGLQEFIVSDSGTLELGYQYVLPANYTGIAAQGDLVYLSSTDVGLTIINVADPTHPEVISRIKTPGAPNGIFVSGSRAYVADSWGGLAIVNISNPEVPSVEGTYDTPGDARDVAVVGEYAYVADGHDGGLQIINVSVPGLPYPVGSYNTEETASAVVVRDSFAYVADQTGGLAVIDISDPIIPRLRSIYPQNSSGRRCDDVAVVGSTLYLSGIGTVVDASNPDTLRLVDTLPNASWSSRLTAGAGYLLTSYGTAGVKIYRTDDPLAPTYAGSSLRHSGGISSVIAQNGYAFAVTRETGVQVLDANGSDGIKEIGYLSAPRAQGIAGYGNYAYVACYDSGTQVIDISDPQHATVVNTFRAGKQDSYVSARDDYMTISSWPTGLTFYRIIDPLHPTSFGVLDMPGILRGVICTSSHAYVATAYLYVVNLVDSATPFVQGRAACGYSNYKDVAVQSNYAYVAFGDSGLVVIDVSQPAHPVRIAMVGGGADLKGAASVVLNGNVAYVGVAKRGVSAVDISDPYHPVVIGSYSFPGEAWQMALSGDKLFVAEGNCLLALRVNQVTGVDDPPSGGALPRGLALGQNYPNPFNPGTTIEFTLKKRSETNLTVFDLLGRRVKELVNGSMAGGPHAVQWDGTDDMGSPVATGVYFYRLDVSGERQTRKMVLLK